MKTIFIHKADCVDNETFEMIAEKVGLSCFDEAGDPLDFDLLTLDVALSENDSSDKLLEIFSNDLDIESYQEIIKILEIKKTQPSILLKVESAYLR